MDFPVELERGDAALLAKALKAYRPDDTEEECTLLFMIEQLEKMAENEISNQEDPNDPMRGAATPFADNH